MKISIYLCTIAIFILCFSCNMRTEDVSITSAVSIQLPSNYTSVDKNHPSGIILYEAKKNEAKFFATIVPVEGLDTLDLDQKTKWLETNIQGHINGFNGKQISNSKPRTSQLLMNEFSFEYSKNGSSFISHSQMILTEEEMIIIMYQTPKPETKQTIKEKNNFFNSLEIK